MSRNSLTDNLPGNLINESSEVIYRQGKGIGGKESNRPPVSQESTIVNLSSPIDPLESISGHQGQGQQPLARGKGGGGGGSAGHGGNGGPPETPGGGGGGGGAGHGGNGGPPETPGGGGGHTETVGNNLSFPVVFPNGYTMSLRGSAESLTLTQPFSAEPDENGFYWFAQQEEGNEWQAGSMTASEPVVIEYIDIGDALESAQLAVGQFIRVELGLYESLSTPMRAYTTELLAGQGPEEVQGICAPMPSVEIPGTSGLEIDELTGTTYYSNLATVYAPMLDLTIQEITGSTDTLAWNGTVWEGEGISPVDLTSDGITPEAKFGPELNVAGKVISGVSDKPWQFSDDGYYRITFSLANGAPIIFNGNTQVGNYANGVIDPILAASASLEGETGDSIRQAMVVADVNNYDTHNGLVYLDVVVGTPSPLDAQSLLPAISPI